MINRPTKQFCFTGLTKKVLTKLKHSYNHFNLREWLINTSFNFGEWLYLLTQKKIYLIQLGANDGVTIDPVYNIITKRKTTAIVVEAVPYIFEKLRDTYKDFQNVIPINRVIVENEKVEQIEFYYLDIKNDKTLPDYLTWWGSLNRSHLEQFRHHVGEDFDRLLKSELLPCTSLNNLFKESGFSHLNILQVDVEGADAQILNTVDFSIFTPHIIMFEQIHCPPEELNKLHILLTANNYYGYNKQNESIYLHRKSIAAYLPFCLVSSSIKLPFTN